MFQNDNTELHELIIKLLILPFLLNEFLPQYAQEVIGGHLMAFMKEGGGLRPLLCGTAWRRCFASITARALAPDATRFFTTSCPNFIQFAGGMRDGTTMCAKVLNFFDSHDDSTIRTPTIINMDIKNAFNSTNRAGAFDSKTGRASREYDSGKIKVGDAIPFLPEIRNFFPYFRAVHEHAGNLRYTDYKGHLHHIKGTKGGQQGDPLEMLSFCLATYPVWSRVMARHAKARAVAFADDGYIHDDLLNALMVLADLRSAMKEDLDLDFQLRKCKVYVKGCTLQEARDKVKEYIDNNAQLACLSDLLHESGNPAADPIQVEGIKCVGVPVGSQKFIDDFVHHKVLQVAQDVQKLEIMSDPVIHFLLLTFCQRPRLDYLSRCLPPKAMRNDDSNKLGIQHLDSKLAHAVFKRGTQDRFGRLEPDQQKWCTYILQLPHHLGGFGFTPGKASGIAAFYSATARFVQWLGSLPNKDDWVRNQDMHDPATWIAPDLLSLTELHSTMIDTYHCVEGPQSPQQNAAAPLANGPEVTHPLSLPPLNSLARAQDSMEDDNADENLSKLPPQKRITAQIMKHWAPHADARSSATPRQQALEQMHKCQRILVQPPKDASASAQSILGDDMPVRADNDDGSKTEIKYSPTAFLSSISAAVYDQAPFDNDDWSSWMCQILGVPIPGLVEYARKPCTCGRLPIDAYGDHIHTCRKYGRNKYDAHRIVLQALQGICQRAGYSSEIKNVPVSNGKRRADLFIKHVKLARKEDMVVDVSVIHEFHGDVLQDVRRNGTLCHQDPSSPILLDSKAHKKVNKYRDDYSRPGRPDRPKAFLPAIMSTSGRIQGELLRLLFILSHRQAQAYFFQLGLDPSNQAFTSRRGMYFSHIRASIGLACAQAIAARAYLPSFNHHRRPPSPPPHGTLDDIPSFSYH